MAPAHRLFPNGRDPRSRTHLSSLSEGGPSRLTHTVLFQRENRAHVVGRWAVTFTVVFRGKKHTFPALGPYAARTEPSLWRLLAVDTIMISNPFLAGVWGGIVAETLVLS